MWFNYKFKKIRWKYLYRAVNSTGNILDILLCANCDFKVVKGLFPKTLDSNYCQSPWVINVDNNPAYPNAIKELIDAKKSANICKLRQNKYLNNIVEQVRRFIKKLANLELRFAFFNTARRSLKGDRNDAYNSQRSGCRTKQGRCINSNEVYCKPLRCYCLN